MSIGAKGSQTPLKLLLATLVVVGVGCLWFIATNTVLKKETLPAAYRGRFLDEAVILNAHGAQGVSFTTFSDQLARTRAAFDLETTWPDPIQKIRFLEAMRGWDAAHVAWRYEIAGESSLFRFGRQKNLIEVIRGFPGNEHVESNEPIKTRLLIREALGYASEQFESGRDRPWLAVKKRE